VAAKSPQGLRREYDGLAVQKNDSKVEMMAVQWAPTVEGKATDSRMAELNLHSLLDPRLVEVA
jgi:hypothetical protein